MATVKPRRRDWYSVSVDSLRAWTTFLFVVAALAVGYFVYRSWEDALIKRDASQAIASAQSLAQQLEDTQGLPSFRREYTSALETLAEARARYEEGAYASALRQAASSRNVLQWIYDALVQKDSASEAQFISVQGGVSYRRGESGEWQPARSRITLLHGDYVRTSGNGSAEIMFANGTLYTVRPDTLFIISPGRGSGSAQTEQSIKMEYGWVNLNTNKQDSSVSTPEADALVQRDSRASVSYDRGSGTARFVAYQGGLKVRAKGGLEREVSRLEEVVQVRDLLSQPKALPDHPEPLAPSDNHQVRFGSVPRLELRWSPVAGVERYALQVSRNHLFVDNIIEAEDRAKTSATLGIQGEGTFLWRVAAIDGEGIRGPWSSPRKFRVASFRGGAAGADTTPPVLEVQDVKSYGSIFILGGSTEPGAEVEINGEPVTVAADGTFTKTVQLTAEGWSFITIRARDAWGNEVEHRQRVFVETL